jgi:hypothetical protein
MKSRKKLELENHEQLVQFEVAGPLASYEAVSGTGTLVSY